MKLKALGKSYNGTIIFKDVYMELNPGSISVLQGHSGCGKTTMLRVMSFLEGFDSGTMEYKSSNLTPEASKSEKNRNAAARYPSISLMMQQQSLWPHMTCLENILTVKPDFCEFQLVENLGVSECLNRMPEGVSLGQAQRIAFIRAVAAEPSTLLLDEPSSALDRSNTKKIAAEINRRTTLGNSILVVTHDNNLVESLNITTLLEMENGKVSKIY